jgi:hypothetical protein
MKGNLIINQGNYYLDLDNLNWENYFGYIKVPSVLGFDNFYRWQGTPLYNSEQFRNQGWAIFPKILAKDGRVYMAYQSPLEYPFCYDFGEPNLYRGIFITVSEDYGASWDVPNSTSWISYHPYQCFVDWNNYSGPLYEPGTGDPYWEGNISFFHMSENAHPSMSYNYKGDLFMLQWANQFEPFFPPDGFQNNYLDIITFSQDLNNIPAYKNLQEVYKGLWNGEDTTLDFPPKACEKPTELIGLCDNKDVLLQWEEPDYVLTPVLGYNVFRNGEKLNDALVTNTQFHDQAPENGTHLYQISATYSDCESKLLGTKVVVFNPQFCEKPVELSGVDDGKAAVITWKKPANIDGTLFGYNLYRDEEKINEEYLLELEYRDEELANGTYTYKVSAAYEHCVESELTEGVSVTILVGSIINYPTGSIIIYPNPTTGELRIENGEQRMKNDNNKGIYPLVVEIFDIYGRKLLSNHLIHSSSNHIIDISHLQPGLYFLRVGGVVVKVVKQ